MSFPDHQVQLDDKGVCVVFTPTSNRGELGTAWAGPGLYCLMTDDVREVGSSLTLADTVEALVLESPWYTHIVVLRSNTGWTEAQLAYLEDRLVHMLKLEDFATGPRISRDHHGMAQEDRLAATREFLAALELLSANGIDLFTKPGGKDADPLVLPLQAAAEGKDLTEL